MRPLQNGADGLKTSMCSLHGSSHKIFGLGINTLRNTVKIYLQSLNVGTTNIFN